MITRSKPKVTARHLLPALILLAIAGCERNQPVASNGSTRGGDAEALTLIKKWVVGNYNNLAQFEADMAADLPAEQTHRPMYQLFAPVAAPNIDGYILFQQSSLDGSEEPSTIFRHGLVHYMTGTDSDILIQRELYFKEPEPHKNLHRNPQSLGNITLDDMTWDEGCDFYLRVNSAGDMVSGPLRAGKCVLFNKGLQKNMYADDLVEITATEYRFRGRYIDAEGKVVWGTESEELNTLVQQ